VHGAATLDAHPEAVRQVAVADRLVLTKADLAGDTAALRRRLAALNPVAPLLPVETPVDAVLGGLFGLDGKSEDVRDWLGAEAVADTPAAAHDVNRHDAAIRAVCLTSEAPVPRPAFEMFLDLLRSGHGAKILRLKGIVALADDPDRPLVVHGVQHAVHAPVALPAWPDPDHTSRLVVILSELDPAFVHRLWDAFLGRPRPDAPDAAALAHNPLAIPGG
ncbi:MAG: GTP-binding protein, partial [Actinomycetospora chiangmaiensis]|nr:GTP-binding protein [Actinomycetospora chiangmaiensis]